MPSYSDVYNNISFLLNLITLSEFSQQDSTFNFFDEAIAAELLDSTKFTSIYCLENAWLQFTRNNKLTLQEVLGKSDSYKCFIKQCELINTLFNDVDYLSGKHAFHSNLTQTLGRLCANHSILGEVTVDDALKLRYEALTEFSNLKPVRFSSGTKSSQPLRYIGAMNVFSDISSLLFHLSNAADSISINLIRDRISPPYFAVCIKDSENITVLHDERTKQGSLSSFPYNWIIQNKLSANEDIMQLTDLSFDKLLWVSLIFELSLQNHVYRHNDLPLSFTTRMACNKNYLVGASSIFLSAIPSGEVFSQLTLSDVHYTKFNIEGFNQPFSRNWIEDRFKHLVPIEALNFIDEKSDVFKLDETDQTIKKNPESYSEGGIVFSDPFVTLTHLNYSDFGSLEELQNHRLKVARSNYVKIINYYSMKFINSESSASKAWILETLRNDEVKKNIFKVATDLLNIFDICDRTIIKSSTHQHVNELEEIIFVGHMRHKGVSDLYGNRKVFFLGGDEHKCALNQTASSYGIVFNINHHTELEKLLGVENSFLPELLQNYDFNCSIESDLIPTNIYTIKSANHFPLTYGISIVIPLSKRGLSILQKQTG